MDARKCYKPPTVMTVSRSDALAGGAPRSAWLLKVVYGPPKGTEVSTGMSAVGNLETCGFQAGQDIRPAV